MGEEGFVKWFSELSNSDVAVAGGKGASLAEMYNNKFPVPPGFVITAKAYSYFIEKAGLTQTIQTLLQGIDIENTQALTLACEKIRSAIERAPMPKELEEQILEAYEVLDVDKQQLSQNQHMSSGALDILRMSHEPPFVAVRSSATTEDLADASFAGQQDSYMNVKGSDELIVVVKKAFASLFTARAVYYRTKKGFDHSKAYLAVVIQQMIDSDKAGVMFSRNPIKNDPNIVIESVWGLGVGLVSGVVIPDHYIVTPELEVIERKIANKKVALTRNSAGKTEYVTLTKERGEQEVLTSHEVKMLAQLAKRLEEHYKKPQDIEFAIAEGAIYITQSRPITTEVQVSEGELHGDTILSGLPASPGVASGKVRIVKTEDDLAQVQKGDVLVAHMTNPDMVVSMQRAAAIITDEGGITSHAAIVSREMGIPAVVGTGKATEMLEEGRVVTVDGFTGRVLEGVNEERKATILPAVPTKTKIKVIVDIPEYAERAAQTGVKGVGLVRLEGIIAQIGKHPAWFARTGKTEEYITALTEGMKQIVAPFEEIWFRTSDVRSDEYSTLEGAPQENESNPMLGDHGIRYSVKNQDILEAELTALKEIADDHPDKKIGIMLPQVISVEEVQFAKKIAKEVHLPENVKFGIMVETPAAVQIINALCEEGINFISFGTNDLTQYTLAIDRNNEAVQSLYDEMHPAVLNSLRYVIRRCKKYGVETSICGQAGSRPEMAAFLVREGIDSISVNADAAKKVSEVVADIESKEQTHTIPEQQEVRKMPEQREEPVVEPVERVVERQEQEMPVVMGAQETTDETEALLAEWGDDAGEAQETNRPEQHWPDEYNPGVERSRGGDIPSLNDAIPIDSKELSLEQPKEEHIIELHQDSPMKEHHPTFEEQQEEVFDEEIAEEIQASEVREAMRKQVLHQGQQPQQEAEKEEEKPEDQVLDIF